MENLPTMDDLDTETTIEELNKDIAEMTFWKASDSDGIPAHLFRHCKSCLLSLLLDILIKCWLEAKVATRRA